MKKKLLNFWYYYKVHIIIILTLLAAGLYFLSLREEDISDYHAAIVSPRGFSDEQLVQIQNVLEQAGQDQTGDNAVSVKVQAFRFAIGENGQDSNEIAKLDADLVGKVSGLFIVEDPKQFEEVTNGIGNASEALPISNFPQFSGCGIEDMYILPRTDADSKYSVMLSTLILK